MKLREKNSKLELKTPPSSRLGQTLEKMRVMRITPSFR